MSGRLLAADSTRGGKALRRWARSEAPSWPATPPSHVALVRGAQTLDAPAQLRLIPPRPASSFQLWGARARAPTPPQPRGIPARDVSGGRRSALRIFGLLLPAPAPAPAPCRARIVKASLACLDPLERMAVMERMLNQASNKKVSGWKELEQYKIPSRKEAFFQSPADNCKYE